MLNYYTAVLYSGVFFLNLFYFRLRTFFCHTTIVIVNEVQKGNNNNNNNKLRTVFSTVFSVVR